jgi:hypothetical protein
LQHSTKVTSARHWWFYPRWVKDYDSDDKRGRTRR